jgi:ribulose-phosphate 3-epimerase
MSVRINPSILAADFAHLATELDRISAADAVHVDVMDNHFVPNLTFGIPVVERLLEVTELPLDMHLMITDVDRWAPKFAELGVFSVTFHAEATDEPVALARRLRQIGARAGLAIKPGTPVEPYLDVLGEFDQLLVMTVEPGFGGQAFMPETASTSGCRSTAASPCRPSRSPPARARTPSWRARAYSGPTTRAPRCSCSARRRSSTRTSPKLLR